MVMPSKYSLTTLSRPCQRGRVLQLPILGQSVLPGSKQATGAMEFSVRRRMLPTVYCSGAFVRRYPPPLPRTPSKSFAFTRILMMPSRYFSEISCLAAVSFNGI